MLHTDITEVTKLLAQSLGRVDICRTDVEVGTCRFQVYTWGFERNREQTIYTCIQTCYLRNDTVYYLGHNKTCLLVFKKK